MSRFIENVSELTAVLRELLKKNVKFNRTDKHNKAFETLKNELSSKKVLAFLIQRMKYNLIPTLATMLLEEYCYKKKMKK